jgi:hypothetical protein
VAGALERTDNANALCSEIEVGPLETGELPPTEAKVGARINEGTVARVDATREARNFNCRQESLLAGRNPRQRDPATG